MAQFLSVSPPTWIVAGGRPNLSFGFSNAKRASTSLFTRWARWAITGSIKTLANHGSTANLPATPLIDASTITPSCGSNGTVTVPDDGRTTVSFDELGADRSSAETVASHVKLFTVVVVELSRRVIATSIEPNAL